MKHLRVDYFKFASLRFILSKKFLLKFPKIRVSYISSITSLFILLTACGGKLATQPSGSTNSASAISSRNYAAGETEPAARFIFHKDHFTNLNQFITPVSTYHQCLGDLLKTFYVEGADYSSMASVSGTPAPFPYSVKPDALSPTYWPAFIKNVSVDITQTYFDLSLNNVVQTDSCSYRSSTGVVTPPSYCADFDTTPATAPTPHVSPTPTPAATPASTPYFDTDFYRVRDDWCTNQGSILSSDTETSKSYVGGVNIDLDRSELGANEDLLMLVTYLSLDSQSAGWPSAHGSNDHTVLKVNLVGTGQTLDALLGAKQPRQWNYYSQAKVYLKEIATLEDPFGTLRTEQVYLPVSQNALIDRVRIDRVRGSYFLFQIDLYRLGNRSE